MFHSPRLWRGREVSEVKGTSDFSSTEEKYFSSGIPVANLKLLLRLQGDNNDQ